MDKPRKSLFEELNSLAYTNERERFVEQKAEHIISGAINLLEFINREFDDEIASDLSKRLVNSIRSKDPRKFQRGIKSVKAKK
jgi:hypothetical protein|tara:strand:+ start:1034 stop:1282 length:249 start_codon:yes stop_codon:yes gene_type:complete